MTRGWRIRRLVTLTRFYSGRLDVADDGTWQIGLQVHDGIDGDSWVSGSSYPGRVDGTEITLMYDWCYNGVPDVQLVFDR